MTGRSVAIQGGLALLVLVLAYTTWQRPPEKQAGEVFVLDITKNDLDKVRFEDQEGKSWSELAKGKDDDGHVHQLAAVRVRQHRRRPALGPSRHRPQAAGTAGPGQRDRPEAVRALRPAARPAQRWGCWTPPS